MSFLAPVFLLGALAIAGPVIFHLIRRTTRDRQRFSSLMFLEPTPPRLTKRSRIEHWLLLLLRAAALGLLALAFARPFFRTQTPSGARGASQNRTVVLLDASASLRRGGLWETVKDRAMSAVNEAAPGSEVAIASFDNAVTALLTFDDWRAADPAARSGLAQERIGAAAPSWSGTDAAAALMAAAEMLSESADGAEVAGRREIVLVTDAQEGSRLEKLQGYEWPKEVRVRIETATPAHAGNAGLQLAADARPDAADTAASTGVRLRVSNTPDAGGESFQLGWENAAGGFEGAATDVYVPPGQSRIVTLPWPESGPKAGRVILRGDAEDFDNTVTVTPPPSVSVPVIHSGAGQEPRGPLSFLQKALPASRALTAVLAHHAPDALPSQETLKAAPLWVITAPVDKAVADAASAWVEAGGTALIMLQTPDMAATLQTITATAATLAVSEVKPSSGYAMFGEIDFGHPLFAAFAEPRFSDFTKIRFWNYCRLDPAALPGARLAARFDSGDPAVLDVPRRKGRVFVLAAGWHPAASQLALSSKFPALLASMLAGTGAGVPAPAQFVAGEPAPAASLMPAAASACTITSPDGKTSQISRADSFPGFTSPGLYHAAWDGGQREIAVNLDPAESRTAPLPVEEYEKLGAPIAIHAGAAPVLSESAQSLAAAAETEGRQKIWRWVLGAVFAVLLIETLLGARTARRYVPTEGGSSP